MNSIDSRIAEAIKLLLGVTTSEPPMSTLCRAFVDPNGNIVAYADANGNLVNGSGGLIGAGQSKAPCAAATTANITIATALNNGDTLDTSVTLATGDRVLVKNQTAPEENGIYIVGVTPIRAPDFDAWGEVPGAVVGVTGGTVNAGLTFIAIAAQTGTIGTTAIAFNPYPSSAGFTSPIIVTDIRPNGNDGATLGTAALSFADLFLASGGTINYANGNVVLTHSSGVITLGTGDLRITTAGTNAASVVTVGGTQTLTNKTLSATRVTNARQTITGDGAITIQSGTVVLTKGSAAAITLAAPSSQDDTEITVISNSDFAHVITFPSAILLDGTTGANTTATFAAFKGAAITLVASGVTWLVKSNNLVTCAP
jgi:hypothetical protein